MYVFTVPGSSWTSPFNISYSTLPYFVGRIKNAHELIIFGIWYSEQIVLPRGPDGIITLPDTKGKTEILTWPFATFQKPNGRLRRCIHQDVTDQRRVQKPIVTVRMKIKINKKKKK